MQSNKGSSCRTWWYWRLAGFRTGWCDTHRISISQVQPRPGTRARAEAKEDEKQDPRGGALAESCGGSACLLSVLDVRSSGLEFFFDDEERV